MSHVSHTQGPARANRRMQSADGIFEKRMAFTDTLEGFDTTGYTRMICYMGWLRLVGSLKL